MISIRVPTIALSLLLLSGAVARGQTGELKRGIDAYWAGDYSTAVSILRKFLESADLRLDILTARKFLAFSYLAVDEKDRAVTEFESILDEDPKYDITSAEAAPSTLRVWKEVRQRKQAKLEEQGKKAKAEAMLEDAKRLFAQGQYPQAAASFREVLKLDPANQWARAYLDQATERAGGSPPAPRPSPGPDEPPPAEGTPGPPPEGGPVDVTANPLDQLPPTPGEAPPPPATAPDVWMPTDAAERRRYNEALRYNNSGLASFQGGNYAAARTDFERAVQTYGTHPMFHWNLGLAQERLRREDIATREYQFVIRTDPQGYGARAHRQLGLLYYRQERWIEAARELEESLRVAPDDLDTRRFLSRAYDRAGNSEMAIQTLVLLVQQAPGNADDRFELGNLHKKKGNTAAAIAEFREVLKLSPNHAQAGAINAFLKAYQPPE